MAKRGRKPVLDDIKKGQIVAILAVGCSRRTAAKFVGCDVSTIRNTAEREPDFAEQLRVTENKQEYMYLQNVQKAAQRERYWRAAAWVLERRFPDDYGRRGPDVVTLAQIKDLLTQFSEIIVEEVPVAEYRKNILKRFNAISENLKADSSKQGRRP